MGLCVHCKRKTKLEKYCRSCKKFKRDLVEQIVVFQKASYLENRSFEELSGYSIKGLEETLVRLENTLK